MIYIKIGEEKYPCDIRNKNMYLTSAIVSLFSLIVTISLMFAEPESYVHMFLDETIVYGGMVIAIVALIAGIIFEIKDDNQTE